MDPIAIIVGLLLLGAATAWVIRPFRAKLRLASKKAIAGLGPREAHKAALAALRDLDFDFRMGKVSAEDYAGLREQLVAEAAKYMEADSEEDDRLEALIRARKTDLAGQTPCPKCGEKLDAQVRFCPRCGTELGSACPSCGKPVRSGDLYCRSCGSKLELRADATA